MRFVTFVHLLFSVQSVDLFRRFTRVHKGHFMLCKKEEPQVELSCKIVLWQIFIGHTSKWFPLLSASRRVNFDTCNLPCVYVLLRLISIIARYAFKSPRVCFRGTKYLPLTCCLLAFYIVRWARLRLELFKTFL